jgi:homoserine acetyltransferase
MEPHNVATQQVRGIIDRFCRGSVENLLVGMVDDNLITPDKLRELAEQIKEAEADQKKIERGKK